MDKSLFYCCLNCNFTEILVRWRYFYVLRSKNHLNTHYKPGIELFRLKIVIKCKSMSQKAQFNFFFFRKLSNWVTLKRQFCNFLYQKPWEKRHFHCKLSSHSYLKRYLCTTIILQHFSPNKIIKKCFHIVNWAILATTKYKKINLWYWILIYDMKFHKYGIMWHLWVVGTHVTSTKKN